MSNIPTLSAVSYNCGAPVQPMREKHQALLRPTSGSFTDGHRLRDGAAGLIRGGEEMMVLMPLASRPPAHQRSGSLQLLAQLDCGLTRLSPVFRTLLSCEEPAR